MRDAPPIQRYDIHRCDFPDKGGAWVRCEDHERLCADLRAKLAAADKNNERLARLWGCDLKELLANAVADDERDAAIACAARLAEALREIAVQAMRGLMTTSISEANEVASIVCDIARAALADSDAKGNA